MNRFRLAFTRLWIPLVLVAVPAAAQGVRPAPRPAPGAPSAADPSRFQMNVMEDAFQRAVEGVHGRALEALQVGAGMPAMFMLDGNTRARAFRLEGYGVFFDVDLPPIPRSVEWSLRVLDTGAVLVGDIQQLQAQLDQLNDPRVKRVLEPIIRNMRMKMATTASASGRAGEPAEGVRTALVSDAAPADPFARYVAELKQILGQIVLEYGPTIQLGDDDWLTVAAREMSPKLMPGNPTDATIILRMRGRDLAALKSGRLSREDAARRIEVKELY